MNNTNQAMLLSDPKEIRRAIAALVPDGQITEVRALHVSSPKNRKAHTVSGYFDDRKKLIPLAARASKYAKGVYIVPNPINRELLQRRANSIDIAEKNQLTTDADIISRKWLLMDFDPERASQVSSTDEEHQAALDRAAFVREELRSRGWPDPILADSGNGAHLVYRIHELANNDESTALIKKVLVSIAFKFDTEMVRADQSVFNAGRIWKLYGTISRKGDHSPERPHRVSRMIEIPPQLIPVSRDQLEELARQHPVLPKRARPAKGEMNFDLKSWITKNSLDVEGPKPWQQGQLWTLRQCQFDPSHTNGTAYLIQHSSGAISAGCQHKSCDNKGWKLFRRIVDGAGSPNDDPQVGADEPPPEDSQKRKQSAVLLQLAKDDVLFHTPEKDAYAVIKVKDHCETWAVASRSYKESLSHRYYLAEGGAPWAQALTETLNQISARANFDGEEFPVFVRIARVGDVVYIDLGTDLWDVVMVTADGWTIGHNPPVRFRRPSGMRALPVPTRDGRIEDLREFLNVDEEGWILILGWLVQALCGRGPYPILILQGGQGAAKSTGCRTVQSIVDPATAGLRAPASNERDLAISANNCHVLAYDNMSGTKPWVSDALCRLTTGGSFATRTLWTNGDEFYIHAKRPVLLNGIDPIATRQDLLDRSIVIEMTSIPEELRRTEKELTEAFDAKRPGILGALLNAVSVSLRNSRSVKLGRKPRMADFAVTATAAEEALGLEPGSFMKAFSGNRKAAVEASIEGNLVVKAIRMLLEEKPEWNGTATDLLEKLVGKMGYLVETPSREWPKQPNVLTNVLGRLDGALRTIGIDVRCGIRQGHDGTRIVTIRRVSEVGENIVSTVSTVSTAATSDLTAAVSTEPTSVGADDPTAISSNDRQHASSAAEPVVLVATDSAPSSTADDAHTLPTGDRQQPSSADLPPQLTAAEGLRDTADDADDADDHLRTIKKEIA